MKARFVAFLLAVLVWGSPATAQSEAPSAGFRRANEFASRSRWDEAIREYGELAKGGVASPSLYWNWAQAASAGGRKGEALWALLRSRDLMPSDANVNREIDRLRGELGLDPSEVSLGFWGDGRIMARRFRFDAIAIAALLVSILATFAKRRSPLSFASFVVGVLFMAPFATGLWREHRGVVVQKEAPLVDAPRTDAVALANLREGEVVPLLGEEGDYVRIQDASGARGFAHRADVLRIENN